MEHCSQLLRVLLYNCGHSLSHLVLPHLSKHIFVTTIKVQVDLGPADVKQLEITVVQFDESHTSNTVLQPLLLCAVTPVWICDVRQIVNMQYNTVTASLVPISSVV